MRFSSELEQYSYHVANADLCKMAIQDIHRKAEARKPKSVLEASIDKATGTSPGLTIEEAKECLRLARRVLNSEQHLGMDTTVTRGVIRTLKRLVQP